MRKKTRTVRKKASAIFLSFILVLTSVSSVTPFFVSNVAASAPEITDHVVINEIFAAPTIGTTWWVELYNPTEELQDISEWRIILTRGDMSDTYYIPENSIEANGFVVIEIPTLLNSRLGDDDAEFSLKSTDITVDTVKYMSVSDGSSFGRIYDAASTFEEKNVPTEGLTNGSAPVVLLPPRATIGSPFISPVQAENTIPFQLVIDKADDSGPANIRIEIELRQEGQVQPSTVKFEYMLGEQYEELPYKGMRYVYGPETGFEMIDASYDFRITFSTSGSYALVSRIINAETEEEIGSFKNDIVVTVPATSTESPVPEFASPPLLPLEENLINPLLAVPATPRTTYVANVNIAAQPDGDADSLVVDTKTPTDAVDAPATAIEPSEQGWKLFGMAWYWWGGIVGLLGGAGWMGRNWYQSRTEV